MQEVQAVINNISFPKTLEELLHFQKVHGQFNVEDILGCAEADNEEDYNEPRISDKKTVASKLDCG